MDVVADFFDKADIMFEKAEKLASSNFPEAIHLFRQGIADLFRAFIVSQGEEPSENPGALFEQCLSLNSEFEVIDTEQSYFMMEDISQLDPEMIIDAANEIWDFIYGLMEEEEEID